MVQNVPLTTTKTAKHTIAHHLNVLACLSFVQLSYRYMQPIGWKQIDVPRRAPIRETRLEKFGTALAMM
jgi:hypothetical protein